MKGNTMRDITLRPIRRECFVPGCRNVNSFVASRSREMPVGVVICAKCAEDIYLAMYPKKEETVEETPVAAAVEAPEPTIEETPPKKTARKKKEDKE